jgi:protoporphyrinogen oxidase
MGKRKTVIAGSGLSALLLARALRKYNPSGEEIVVIERDRQIGGQFGSIDYGSNGFFDYGMHIYYECSRPEIDTLFTGLMPDEEWNILENNRKDIAGIYYNGVLQTGTPYPDLRSLPEEKRKAYIGELFLNMEKAGEADPGDNASCHDILNNHFGALITNEVFTPILQKLYERHPSELDQIATQLTTINRVALFNEAVMSDLMKAAAVRARICYPDQLTLPPYRTSPQRGFYPRKYGMVNVCNLLKRELEKENVTFLTSTQISSIDITDDRITALKITSGDKSSVIEDLADVYWSAGLPPLSSLLKLDTSDLQYDKQVNVAFYVNVLLDKPPVMGELYYFYCFDKGFRTFRVTNYTSYCPDAAGARGYPVCVEMWMKQTDPADQKEVTEMALKELKTFGVIDETHKVLFSDANKPAGGGFPLPTRRNVENMNTIRERIAERNISNLRPIGVYADKNVFFIKDVLMHMFRVAIGDKTTVQ